MSVGEGTDCPFLLLNGAAITPSCKSSPDCFESSRSIVRRGRANVGIERQRDTQLGRDIVSLVVGRPSLPTFIRLFNCVRPRSEFQRNIVIGDQIAMIVEVGKDLDSDLSFGINWNNDRLTLRIAWVFETGKIHKEIASATYKLAIRHVPIG